MKTFVKITLTLIVILLGVYILGPKPKHPLYNTVLPQVPELAQLDQFVKKQDALHKIKPGNEAEIVWADSSKKQSEYAVIYLHGFSASKVEGNPVFYHLAKKLNANLYLPRLADHGIDTIAPMQYFTADKLWESSKQALVIGKKLGKKVILMGTSTGGTLALKLASTYPEINSLILISPNIAINDDKAWLLNNPWGLQIARSVVGGMNRVVEGKSSEYKKYWYTTYRLESVVQLEELLESSMNAETFNRVKQPTLLLYYYRDKKHQDNVVKVNEMRNMFAALGTPNKLKQEVNIPDGGYHVLGSYLVSKNIPAVEKAMDNFIDQIVLNH